MGVPVSYNIAFVMAEDTNIWRLNKSGGWAHVSLCFINVHGQKRAQEDFSCP